MVFAQVPASGEPLPRLLAGEAYESVDEISLRLPAQLPPPAAVLMALARVDSPWRMGDEGPLHAATVADANAEEPGLRRFECVFGRDSLQCALFLAPYFPDLLAATVKYHAGMLGVRTLAAADEEPGRAPHEVRSPDDPVAKRLTAESGWAWPYYGSVDSTPMFIAGAARAITSGRLDPNAKVTGRNGKSLRVIDAVAQATGWLWRRLSTSPSGLLESVPAQPRSIENQVWKDSGDSYHHLDRSLATRGTIASVEVIGLCYDALLGAAVLAKGHKASWSAKTPELLARAAALQMVLPRLVCSDSEGFYVALGFDRDTSGAQRLIGARTSNPGRLLASAILSSSAPTTACALSPAERTDLARLVARGVLSPSMRSTAGVRTLSASSSRYRPSAYHNGSVWPFDTMAIAVGLADHGIETGARELARGVVETCEANRCYPEFVNGETGQLSTRRVFVSGREGRNCIEQPPQLLQAWTVSAYFVAQHLLGSGPGDIASV